MTRDRTLQTTRSALLAGVCLAAAAFGLIGCQNTAEGLKEDAAKNGPAIENAAQNTATAIKNAADKAVVSTKSAGESATVTPKVKSAIVGNAKLNDSRNKIDVDTKDGVVYLKGHVINNDEKRLAGDIATKAVKENGSNEKIMNQLTVTAH